MDSGCVPCFPCIVLNTSRKCIFALELGSNTYRMLHVRLKTTDKPTFHRTTFTTHFACRSSFIPHNTCPVLTFAQQQRILCLCCYLEHRCGCFVCSDSVGAPCSYFSGKSIGSGKAVGNSTNRVNTWVMRKSLHNNRGFRDPTKCAIILPGLWFLGAFFRQQWQTFVGEDSNLNETKENEKFTVKSHFLDSAENVCFIVSENYFSMIVLQNKWCLDQSCVMSLRTQLLVFLFFQKLAFPCFPVNFSSTFNFHSALEDAGFQGHLHWIILFSSSKWFFQIWM